MKNKPRKRAILLCAIVIFSFVVKNRASEAAKLGRYRLIEDMFSQTNYITKEDLERHGAANLSLEDFYTSLAHRKEDFIAK